MGLTLKRALVSARSAPLVARKHARSLEAVIGGALSEVRWQRGAVNQVQRALSDMHKIARILRGAKAWLHGMWKHREHTQNSWVDDTVIHDGDEER